MGKFRFILVVKSIQKTWEVVKFETIQCVRKITTKTLGKREKSRHARVQFGRKISTKIGEGEGRRVQFDRKVSIQILRRERWKLIVYL